MLTALPKILIVDDCAENLKILARILRPHFAAVFAKNGPDALQIALSEKPPVLVLLDIVMPGMDGWRVCRQLKEDKRTREIPVIFVTGKTDDNTLEKAFETGASDYVRKPVNRVELLSRIKSVLTRKSLMDRVIGEEKLKSVIETAGSVCHEMNQPIQTISSYAELLMMKLPASHQCRQYASIIRKQIDNMGEITGKLTRITEYETRDYLGKTKIIDLDRASKKNRR